MSKSDKINIINPFLPKAVNSADSVNYNPYKLVVNSSNENTGTMRRKMVIGESNQKKLTKIATQVKRDLKALRQAKKAELAATKAKEDKKTEAPKPQPVADPAPTQTENKATEKKVNQISAKDFPNLYDGLNIDVDKLGCIMLDTVKIPVGQYVKDGEDDVFYKDGWGGGLAGEDSAHVTLLFGLLENGNTWKNKVDMVLEGWKCESLTIEEVSYFDLGDSYAIIGLVEKTSELIDGHERLTLLPHINTFSEYHPHITLAYIKHDVDPQKWVKPLAKKYNGQKVRTTAINYGDLPEKKQDDTKSQNEVEAQQHVLSHVAGHWDGFHDEDEVHTNQTLEKAKNALDLSMQDQVILQESNLQQAVARLEEDIAKKVMEALRKGNIDEAEEIISQTEEEGFVGELAIILAGFFLVLFPIYATQLLFARLSEFGLQGVFAMDDASEKYIRDSARKAAVSHVRTVIKDFTKAYVTKTDEVVRKNLADIIERKAQERDQKVLGKLPANPNREDIEKAVNDGKFDNDPAYKQARDMLREGAGLEEVVKSLQQTYSNMARTRAVTIARHESSRVFNMSQYQADLQFLKESGMLPRAYKRLRSRTGEPCPVCAMLIKATTEHPIPFTTNFASLGEELTATYKKPNGKTAVQKMPITYEAIVAGNVHVNCRCEYVLVIKNEDGTWLNHVDFRVYNAKGDGYNPYRDSRGRFDDGPSLIDVKEMTTAEENEKKVKKARKELAKKGVVLTEEEAKNATKDSVYKKALYHGTSVEAADSIRTSGFKVTKDGGRLYGDGVYMTKDAVAAYNYATGRDSNTAKTIGAYINVQNVYDEKKQPPIYELVNERMIEEGVWDSVPQNPTFAQYERWHELYREIANKILDMYDAIIVPADDQQTGMVLVKDPNNIKIFEIDDSKTILDREFEKLL